MARIVEIYESETEVVFEDALESEESERQGSVQGDALSR